MNATNGQVTNDVFADQLPPQTEGADCKSPITTGLYFSTFSMRVRNNQDILATGISTRSSSRVPKKRSKSTQVDIDRRSWHDDMMFPMDDDNVDDNDDDDDDNDETCVASGSDLEPSARTPNKQSPKRQKCSTSKKRAVPEQTSSSKQKMRKTPVKGKVRTHTRLQKGVRNTRSPYS